MAYTGGYASGLTPRGPGRGTLYRGDYSGPAPYTQGWYGMREEVGRGGWGVSGRSKPKRVLSSVRTAAPTPPPVQLPWQQPGAQRRMTPPGFAGTMPPGYGGGGDYWGALYPPGYGGVPGQRGIQQPYGWPVRTFGGGGAGGPYGLNPAFRDEAPPWGGGPYGVSARAPDAGAGGYGAPPEGLIEELRRRGLL